MSSEKVSDPLSPAGVCPFHGERGSDQVKRSFPFPRTDPFAPPPEYVELRAKCPVAPVSIWDGSTAWLLTRYDDVRQVLSDTRFSSDPFKAGYPHQNAGIGVTRQKYRALVSLDPPEHAPQRRLLTGEFTAKRMEPLRPKITKIAEGLIDGMLAKGGGVDLVEEYALPIPTQVICELLGVPYEDRAYFHDRMRLITLNSTPVDVSLKAVTELCDGFLGDLIHRKNADPQDDLLSRLAVNYMRTNVLAHHDVVSISRSLLSAGHETAASIIGLGTLLFLQHPEQIEALRQEPKLITAAVEEVLRFVGITQSGRRRIATADVEVNGQLIRAGEGVIALDDSAGRDESAFKDAHRFDIRRSDSRHHIAFGYGVHQCLGQALARIELEIAFLTLFTRIPKLRMAVPLEQIRFKSDVFIYGAHHVPVTW